MAWQEVRSVRLRIIIYGIKMIASAVSLLGILARKNGIEVKSERQTGHYEM
jgi:hypothetical protein